MTESVTETTASDNKTLKAEKDKVVAFHYRMCRVDDNGEKGPWLEDNFDTEPSHYLHGHRNLIPALEMLMTGKTAGEEMSATLKPEDAFGVRQDNATQRVPIKHLHLPKKKPTLRPGMVVNVQTNQGVRQATVLKSGKFNVDLDFNHPLAGETLHYEVRIESVRSAAPEEISHGHVHGPGGHHH